MLKIAILKDVLPPQIKSYVMGSLYFSSKYSTKNKSQTQEESSDYDTSNMSPNSPLGHKLYETHIETSYLQKSLLTIGSAVTSLVDPRRHDMIAVLGETTGYIALKKIHSSMATDTEGIKILTERPRINTETINIAELSTLPNDTLGFSYSQFLKQNKVTPDSRLPVRFVDSNELAYVMQRYREVHDLFHTILGMPTNMLGEVAVKWVEALQTGLPMCISGALFGPIRLRPKQRLKYVNSVLPWALRVGKNAKPLMNIYYENRWEQSIEDLRNELKIETPPNI